MPATRLRVTGLHKKFGSTVVLSGVFWRSEPAR
jgi:hypothetical protein